MDAEPLDDHHVDGASRYCLDSLTRVAAGLAGLGVRTPTAGDEASTEFVGGFLAGGEEGDRAAWVLVDGTHIRGFVGATFVELAPDDWRYTFMPPRFASIAATGCHLESPAMVNTAFDAVCPLAADRGAPRLLVAAPPGADAARAAWRGCGLRPDVVMAVREVTTGPLAGAAPDGIAVRTAAVSDIEALTDLALEEHLYHATHTATGVSPDQPRETSRRIAEQAVAASADSSRQLVAEHAASGAVVGSLAASVHVLGDDQLSRFLLPPRYGYIGLTSVTATHRGAGTGRALVDAALRWFAEERVDSVFLHYVVDNPLSARFWARLGFRPHIHTDGLWI
jgi:GNAT superfamily N-acetyltransferase